MTRTSADRMALLEELVLAHQARLRAYLFSRTGSFDAADDLAQETFLVAYRLIDQYDPARPAWPWLMGIARNELREYWRLAARDRVTDEIEAIVAGRLLARDDQEKDAAPDRPVLAALADCLRKLPSRSMDLVRMIYHDRLNCAEAARKLQQSAGSIRVTIHRVRRTLHECVRARLAGGPA
jgi:RNA polymerase sigma-70 factor (ECF subfamily)